jgi:hypothetical protein
MSKARSNVARAVCFAILLAVVASQVRAQDSAKTQTAAAQSSAPAANPADVSSPDALIAAMYDSISGPATQKRDWNRFRALFAPGARLIPTTRAEDGSFSLQALSPEEFIQVAEPYFAKNGFYERESARKSERYGNIMQIFSTYESRHDAKDEKPFARGINSVQFFYDGKRWWIVTIYWQEESPDSPLPKEFLPK